MKRGLLASYVHGITTIQHGARYRTILKLFVPEFITALLLFSLTQLFDARFIAHLHSTSAYTTLQISQGLLHFLIKIAEGVSISLVIVGGQHNRSGEYREVGKAVNDVFWVVFTVGAVVSAGLFFGAYYIYLLLGVTPKMIHLGVPFLRLRAIGIFFTFLYFAFVAFLRSIKNTHTPMRIFVVGALVFLFFDYALIFGAFGMPELKLQGAALAGVIQYAVMLALVVWTIFYTDEYRQYGIKLFQPLQSWDSIRRILSLSWPLILDKATMAAAYLWLGKMMAPMGKYVLASFCVIKGLEQIAFLPAIAFASIITILASNEFKQGESQSMENIKANIKKVVFLASIMVFTLLSIISYDPSYFIRFFDLKGAFTNFSANAFRLVSVLVFFDILQLILAGAARGIGRVRLVMWVRFFVCVCLFFPLSYGVTLVPFKNPFFKFIIIYAMFYVCNALMSVIYIRTFRRIT